MTDIQTKSASRRGTGSGWKVPARQRFAKRRRPTSSAHAKLKEHGDVLLVVIQPATIGALPDAVARADDVAVAYHPGLAMRRIAELHAGEPKTDARDAYIIAEVARSMPDTLFAEIVRQRDRGGLHLDYPAILDLIERHPSSAQLAAHSEKQLAKLPR